MKMKICTYTGCHKLIPLNGPSRCEEHKFIPFKNAKRSNEGLYRNKKWIKLKQMIKDRDIRCVECGSEIDLEVHHIIPPRGNEELFYNITNLQLLCKVCHRKKTNKEIRNRITTHTF